MSTYDYIFRDRVEKESRKERMKRKDQLAVGYHGRCSCLRRKVCATDHEISDVYSTITLYAQGAACRIASVLGGGLYISHITRPCVK